MFSTVPVRFKGLDIRQKTYADGNGFTLNLHTPSNESQNPYVRLHAYLRKSQTYFPDELHANGNGEVVFQHETDDTAGRLPHLKTLPYDVYGSSDGKPALENETRWNDKAVGQLTKAMIVQGKAPAENKLRETCMNAVKRFVPEPWKTDLLAFIPTSNVAVDMRHHDRATGTVYHYDKAGQLRLIERRIGDRLVYDPQGNLTSTWWGYRADGSQPQAPVNPPQKWDPSSFNPETDRIEVILGNYPGAWED